MEKTDLIRRAHKPSEEGYILLAVIFMLVLFVIAMAVAAPRISADIQRDREVETMHRGKQYARAIQLYYHKFNAYPPSIDALVKTNEIRFLRKKYIDPITGKDDWKPVAFGQNKTPMAMGFLGQPLGGPGATPIAGVGPSGGNGIAGATNAAGGISSSNGPTSMFGNSGTTTGAGGAGNPGGTTPGGTPGASGGTGGTDANGNPTSGTMGSGPTFGGAGIVGVTPASTKQSILTYKKKNHYNEWEFLYSPLSEQQQVGGSNTNIGQPANGTNGGGVGGGGMGGPGGG